MSRTVRTTTRPIMLPDHPDEVAAGRALHEIEHPCVDPSVWELLDEPSRTWWVDRARPIVEALRRAS